MLFKKNPFSTKVRVSKTQIEIFSFKRARQREIICFRVSCYWEKLSGNRKNEEKTTLNNTDTKKKLFYSRTYRQEAIFFLTATTDRYANWRLLRNKVKIRLETFSEFFSAQITSVERQKKLPSPNTTHTILQYPKSSSPHLDSLSEWVTLKPRFFPGISINAWCRKREKEIFYPWKVYLNIKHPS